ncbi:hypothetical protein [Amycolatopsis thailandensis]|uniref:hypothetical protein n=1 Tax=Amycolatopsis thailandensis TaxID=589330 RepID=UPI003627FD09
METGPPSLPPVSAWRKFFKRPLFFPYHRLIALTIAVNVALMPGSDLKFASEAVLINLVLAVVIRQRHVINLLFETVRLIPSSWPLWIRRTGSKINHYGGVHVGAGVSAMLWYLHFLVYLVLDAAVDGESPWALEYLFTYAIAVLMVAICVFAHPAMRRRHHNAFEKSHRYLGWSALGLFWLQTLVCRSLDSLGNFSWHALLAQPQPWALLLVSLCLIFPWKNLRKVPVSVERPSPHVAIVTFDYGWKPFSTSGTAFSRTPLGEWHTFAAIEAPPGGSGYRVMMARAGDWTAQFIDEPPKYVWVRTGSVSAPGRVVKIFNRVLYVATGSGIGPILDSLIARAKQPGSPAMALLWIARDPRTVFGEELVDEVLRLVPEARIVDTATEGKPDISALTYQCAVEFDADAVFCTSNRAVTFDLIQELECRGIVANGAVFDS